MRRWLLLLLAVGVIAYGLTGVVVVRPGERAVVRRFGRVLDDKPGPGLWLGLPWGMDRVDLIAVDRVQSVTVGYRDEEADGLGMPFGQMLTGDQNLVNVQAVLYYKVRPEELSEYVAHQDRVAELLARASETVIGEWAAGRTVDDVLLNGKNVLRSELVGRTQERINGYGLGVDVLDARVSLIAPPAEVKSAFDAVAQAQTKIATKINIAEQEAEAKLRAARAEAYRTEQLAVAYAGTQTLLARREAERFLARLAQYRAGAKENPFYLRQIWEEERGKVFAVLKENGQLGLLDHHLGADGLDLSIAPALPGKKP
jgi:membrane protease subunit HflK